jgi:hypothetical protein
LVAFFLASAVAFAGNPNPPAARIFNTATMPTNGVNEVQLLTFSGTITGGSFILRFNNRQTGPISWSATSATLVSSIDSALKALASIGSDGVHTAAGTLAAGIGTVTVTFIGKNAKLDVAQMTTTNSLTGSGANLVISTLTPGVTADGRNSNVGSVCVAQDTGITYINVGTASNPFWKPNVYIPTPTPVSTSTPTPTPNSS